MIIAYLVLGAVSADRPTVTEGAGTVPAGSVQIEAGVEGGRQSVPVSARPLSGATPPDVDSFAAPLEVRVGVTEHIEVHFEGVAYTWVEGDEGLPDFEIGGKANLYADSIFSAGVSGGVTVPLGFGDVASDGDYLLAAAGLVDVTLTPAVALSVNIGFEQLLSDRGDGNRIPLGAALSFALGDIGLFIDGSRGSELSGDAALPTTTSFGVGGSYLLTDTVLLDTFVRRVASDELEGFVGGAGIAVVL